MDYATVDDMIGRYGERELVDLTDLVNIPPSTVDAGRVAVKLGDAQAFVDGYVGQVYRLPLIGCKKPPTAPNAPPTLVPPPVLTRLTCDLARYYLHDDLAPENEVYRRFRAAVKELEAISTGAALLSCPWGGSPGDLVGSDAQQEPETQACFAPPAITPDSLRGFG